MNIIIGLQNSNTITCNNQKLTVSAFSIIINKLTFHNGRLSRIIYTTVGKSQRTVIVILKYHSYLQTVINNTIIRDLQYS